MLSRWDGRNVKSGIKILVARIDSFSIGDPEQDIIGRTLMSGTLRVEMSHPQEFYEFLSKNIKPEVWCWYYRIILRTSSQNRVVHKYSTILDYIRFQSEIVCSLIDWHICYLRRAFDFNILSLPHTCWWNPSINLFIELYMVYRYSPVRGCSAVNTRNIWWVVGAILIPKCS